jgi:hypothetical protein
MTAETYLSPSTTAQPDVVTARRAGAALALASVLAMAGFTVLGSVFATGVVIPLIDAASLSNFAGCVAWCGWLIAVAVVLFRLHDTSEAGAAA